VILESPIVVFSHLRWNFVYQRPQQVLSRLSSSHRVIFIEEPCLSKDGTCFWNRSEPAPNVLVYQPMTPSDTPGFRGDQLGYLKGLMQELEETEVRGPCITWFYTPMALPLAGSLNSVLTIYDCMDELSAFLNAPPELLAREHELFQIADLVFTGGPSLYRAKKDLHPNVHCFPSSVDRDHFGRAASGLPDPPEQASLPRPRLGYFGVVDERIHIRILDELAQSHPEWQVIIVGPVVKIDAKRLPKHANLHYLGQQPYDALPHFISGWDVCLLPFARNTATRFISPTKTLEYMAAERMIVSTPITDVAEPYSEIVYLADTPRKFVQACEQALTCKASDRALRTARMLKVLSQTSWDSTAMKMRGLIHQTMAKRPVVAAASSEESSGEAMPPVHLVSGVASTWSVEPGTGDGRTVVIGAGPTGLSAAYHLGQQTLLVEERDRVGGLCRSIEKDGFTFDLVGHIMFSNDPYVHELYNMLLGENVHWQDREAWIYSKSVYTRYPFQGALYGLPPSVIKDCLVGAIEARFGSLNGEKQPAARVNGSSKNGGVKDCCGDGILEATAAMHEAAAAAKGEPRNFEEFIYRAWGAGIAKHFAIPYNRKLWAVPLTEMETSWLSGRVPLPDLSEMIEGALHPVPKPMGPNARFGYPLRGGFQALMDGFLPHLKGELWLGAKAAAVSPSRRQITFEDGRQVCYDRLISTMPLPVFVELMGDEAPAAVRAAAAGLRHIAVRCVHLGVGREKLTEKHWIYFPEETVFHRVFVQGNASPYCNPPGGFGFTCEITHSPQKPLPCEGRELIERCVADCRAAGLIGPNDPILTSLEVDLPYSYVIYDHARKRNVGIISDWLATQNIILAGRYSEWEYYNSDHAFLAGKRAAERVQALMRDPQPPRQPGLSLAA